MIILHIETSTPVCSVAVSENGILRWNKESFNGPSHSTLLGTLIDEALQFVEKNESPISAVSVSKGPGSYTGLRIGVSMAKGICYGLGIPLIAVDTLKIMTVEALSKSSFTENAILCPMIDARRMEVYCAMYDKQLEEKRPIAAEIITENSFNELLATHPVYFFGNGSDKIKTILNSNNSHYIENIHPLAKNMVSLAEKTFLNQQFEDVAYFEPFYLKEFVGTIPKKNKAL